MSDYCNSCKHQGTIRVKLVKTNREIIRKNFKVCLIAEKTETHINLLQNKDKFFDYCECYERKPFRKEG